MPSDDHHDRVNPNPGGSGVPIEPWKAWFLALLMLLTLFVVGFVLVSENPGPDPIVDPSDEDGGSVDA